MNKLALILLLMMISLPGFSQKPDTLIKKLDSLSHKTDSAGGQKNNITPAAYNENTKLNAKSYLILLGSDLKQEFTKPFHMTRKDWIKFVPFAAGVGLLTLVDEPIQKQAVKLPAKSPALAKTSKFITNFGGTYECYTLGAFGAYGFIFKNQKMKTTTLLATQAYITGAAIESVMKFLSGRTRPDYYDPAVEAQPKFLGPFGNTAHNYNGSRSNSSFPSGHATVSFAAATVFAMEYKNKPWVPILAYSAASLISLTRITENRHWTTDIIVGAALGYLTGKHVVDNYHRYAKLKAPQTPKNSVSFNLDYYDGQVRPGLVYHIR